MTAYGYTIVATPIVDIEPDPGVKQAMNEINRQERLKKASSDKGEAAKILAIKEAEAEAESIRIRASADADAAQLAGEGLSRQRQAIVDGLAKSVSAFQSDMPGVNAASVLDLVLIAQYFDTIKDVAANTRTNAIFLQSGPGAINSIAEEMRKGVMEASLVTSGSPIETSEVKVISGAPPQQRVTSVPGTVVAHR